MDKEIGKIRKAFSRSENRYIHPHKEAMNLRLLWTNTRRPGRARDMLKVRSLYKEVTNSIKNEEDWKKVSTLITKGLLLNPKFHRFYAIRGDMYMRQGKWTNAIKSFENARSTAKFDSKLTEKDVKALYHQQLLESYTQRAAWHSSNKFWLEALSDYEQILIFTESRASLDDLQDKLLEILRKLDKYEAFRFYWDQFILDVNPTRKAVLLTLHAEYKIHLRNMTAARMILMKALELDKNNIQAQKLLQVVYNTGHIMSMYTIIWCMHGCYEKALMTIEKARDSDPYNPGFTLLKTIVLRSSGKLAEASAWLERIDKDFNKLVEPSLDKYGSMMGKLSIDETRNELIKQWYLIRYDMALRCMLNGNHEKALGIIRGCNLTKYYPEADLLLGDGLLKMEKTEAAFKAYLECRKKRHQLHLPKHSRKNIDLLDRIIDILNDRAKMALQEGRPKVAIAQASSVLRILDEDQIQHRLGSQRGRALFYKSRGHFQTFLKGKKHLDKTFCETAAESLRFVRGIDDTDLYRSLYGDIGMEEVIDRYAPKRKLPNSMKIYMQYS